MRALAAGWIFLLGWLTPLEWAAATPSCRLDSELVPYVKEAMAKVLPAMRQRIPGWPFRDVAVHVATAEPQVVRIELVRDADSAQVGRDGCIRTGVAARSRDRDDLSVRGLCEAPLDPTEPVRCSADGLRVLTAEDRRRGRESPALFYVLSHELSHLHHRDRSKGNFLPALLPLDRTLPLDSKVNILRAACQPASAALDQNLAMEVRADREALDALTDYLAERSRQNPQIKPESELALNAMQIEVAASALQKWDRSWQKQAQLPRPLVDSPSRTDEDFIQWAADRSLCDLTTSRRDMQLVPLLHSDHPLVVERLMRISTTLAAQKPGPPVPSAVGAPIAGAALDLLANIGRANAAANVLSFNFLKRFNTEFCGRVNRNVFPKCWQVAERMPEPPQKCPLFSGELLSEELTADATPLPVTRSGSTVQLEERATAALRVGGNLLIGLRDPGRLVVVPESGSARSFKLPCQPAFLSPWKEGHAVLCEDPFGVVLLKEGRPVRFAKLLRAQYNDEAMPVPGVRAGWLGVVAGRLFATVHMPGPGSALTVQVEESSVTNASHWKTGCALTPFAMAAWQFAPGEPVFGTNWNSTAALHTVRFDPEFTRAKDFAAPSGRPFLYACGPSFLHKSVLCVDLGGRIFSPLLGPKRTPLVQLALPKELLTVNGVRGRLCGTKDGAFVLSRAGALGPAFLHAARYGATAAQPLERFDGSEVELVCTPEEALLLIQEVQRTQIRSLRLP